MSSTELSSYSACVVLQVKGESGALVFDHKLVARAGAAPVAMHLDDLALEIRIFKAVTDDIQHIGAFTLYLQHHAGRIAGQLLAAHGGVPADDDPVARLASGWIVIELKPVPFDQVATFRDRLLLVLGGKIQGSST
jgi:hypothetical protein